MARRSRFALALALCVAAAPGLTQEIEPGPFPDEFIGGEDDPTAAAAPDWLSDAITRPHGNIATSVDRPSFTVQPIGAVQLDAVGLLPPGLTGLPRDLWGVSEPETLARLFRAQPTTGVPAALDFTRMLALAELLPPAPAQEEAAAPDGTLFLARLDLLLARGALDPALALMERAGTSDPEVFRRFFDVSLLTDHANRACTAMAANPDIAPTFPARIFCLARSGDWSAAALSLGTAEAIGRITEAEADLLARFLDPELFAGEPRLLPEPTLTPLSFTLRMAIAERPDLTGAPLAFVHADLSPLAGWRAQIDAAERLSRSGAITPAQWFVLVTARRPSASGSVWDRVAAVQALDAALLASDAAAMTDLLLQAWDLMQEVGMGAPFASVFADRLARLALSGEAGEVARRMGLLTSRYETVAQSGEQQSPLEALGFAIARGETARAPGGADMTTRAVVAAFDATPPAHPYRWYLNNDRLGEAMLRAAIVLTDPERDPNDLTGALSFLREVGLEDLARRTALQILFLDT